MSIHLFCLYTLKFIRPSLSVNRSSTEIDRYDVSGTDDASPGYWCHRLQIGELSRGTNTHRVQVCDMIFPSIFEIRAFHPRDDCRYSVDIRHAYRRNRFPDSGTWRILLMDHDRPHECSSRRFGQVHWKVDLLLDFQFCSVNVYGS